MIVVCIISSLLIAAGFWAKGNMDKSADGKFTGRKSHFNKSVGWENKYAYPLQPYVKKWYYFGLITPKYKEKFPLSTTVFVFITDYWHWNQFLFLNNIIIAITYLACQLFGGSVLAFFICFAVVKIISSLTFNYSYEKK